MAIGDALAGLTEGLAKGLGTGIQLGQRNRLLDIQQKQADIEANGAFLDRLLKFSQADPHFRKAVGPSFFKDLSKSFEGREVPDWMQKGLIEGDQTGAAVYSWIASEIGKGKKWEDVLQGLTKQPGDWKANVQIMENVYTKFRTPEEKLKIEKQQTAIQGMNAATSRMNAETSREANQEAIIKGRITREIFNLDMKGEPIPDPLQRAAERLGIDLKARKTITLSPGQVVIDARSGQPIFEAPQQEKTVTVSPGQVVVDKATGREIYRAEDRGKTITVSPGQRVITPDGRVIYEAPEKEQTVTVSPGQRVIDPKDGRVIFASPDKPTKHTLAPGSVLVDDKGGVIARADPKAEAPSTWTTNSDYTDKKTGITIGKGERLSGVPSPDGRTVRVTGKDDKGEPVEIDIPTGNLVKTTVQTGAAAPEGTESRARLANQKDAIDLGIRDATALAKLIEGGMKTGTAASWKRFIQSSIGQSKQFSEFVGLVSRDAVKKMDAVEHAQWFGHDARLTTAQVLENALVYRYAATLAPGNERVPLEVLRQVRERIGLTEGWMNDPATAKAKLAQVLREFGATRQAITARTREDTRSPLRRAPKPDFDATRE